MHGRLTVNKYKTSNIKELLFYELTTLKISKLNRIFEVFFVEAGTFWC